MSEENRERLLFDRMIFDVDGEEGRACSIRNTVLSRCRAR